MNQRFFSSCSCYNAFSNLQLQSRIAQDQHYGQKPSFAQLLQCVLQPPAAIPRARSVTTSLMLCCVQPRQCVLSQPLANPQSRGITPNRPTFAQRRQSTTDPSGFCHVYRFKCEIALSLQSGTHFADPIFQKCPDYLNFYEHCEVQI